MKGNPRAWWWAGVLIAGIGLALFSGAGIAAADTGSSSSSYQSQSPSNHPAQASSIRATTVKYRPAMVAVARISSVANSNAVDGRQLSAPVTQPIATIGTPDALPARSPPRSARVATLIPQGEAAAKPVLPAWSNPDSGAANPLVAAHAAPSTNWVTGVQVGHSDLVIPNGSNDYTAPADWYFPTQADGSVHANGVIWFQHGFLADKSFYSKLATQLAQQTNSIVVAPNLPSFPPASVKQAVAALFQDDQAALNTSAIAAGYNGTLPEQYILAGHSAGGGFAASIAGYTVDNGAAGNGRLRGVLMFDGVSSVDSLRTALQSLDALEVPVYQIAAPPQLWNAFGATTDELLEFRPDQFHGVVLIGGSHVDSMLGSNPIVDSLAQLVTRSSPSGNTAASYTLSAGWINDMYVGAGPTNPQYGFYRNADEPIIMGDATAVGLTPTGFDTTTPAELNGVTGVKVGRSNLGIPCGPGYVASADWYLPTQADGSVQANGVIWLQHGLLGDKSLFVVLARELAQRTNSIVVAPTLTSVPLVCNGCWVDGVAMNRAIAELFVGDRAALNASANAAGYQGKLPPNYILSGHSIGGGIAAAAGGFSVENGAADGNLLGVVMFDGVSLMMDGTSLVDTFSDALNSLDTLGIPVYQIAAPPQTWNNRGVTTDELAARYPGKFVGVEFQNGSHSDAILDSKSSQRYDLLVNTPSPPGNTAAVYTLASGWINDMYVGAGPGDPRFGIYGGASQSIVMGHAIAVALATPLVTTPLVTTPLVTT